MYFCQNASLEDLYSIFRPGCWVNSFIDRHAKRSQRKRGRPPHARNHCLHHNYQQPSSQQHGRVHFAPNRRQNTFLAISNPQQGLYWWRKVPGQWLWQYVNLICDPEGLILTLRAYYWLSHYRYLHTYLPPTLPSNTTEATSTIDYVPLYWLLCKGCSEMSLPKLLTFDVENIPVDSWMMP